MTGVLILSAAWLIFAIIGAGSGYAAAYGVLVRKCKDTRWSKLPRLMRLTYRIPATELSNERKESRQKGAEIGNFFIPMITVVVAISQIFSIKDGHLHADSSTAIVGAALVSGVLAGHVFTLHGMRWWLINKWAPNHRIGG